ncbi:MAG TPA: hypothetical protein DEB40_14665 [Elusimicrobia bacterium]|nr:hypothetical protein [Elusimicrobiota bacterium]HBT62977.1 hypothetical protein [Elusimicrobiota bacterium]
MNLEERMETMSWDLRDVVKIFAKRLWVIPVVMAVCLAAGVLALCFLTPLYESSVKILIAGTPKIDSPFYERAPLSRDVSPAMTHAEIAASQDFLRDVARALGLDKRQDEDFYSAPKRYVLRVFDQSLRVYEAAEDFTRQRLLGLSPKPRKPKDQLMKTVETLAKRVHVEAVDRTDVMRVSVLDFDPETAAAIANALAQRFSIFVLRQEASELSLKYGSQHPLSLQLEDDLNRIGSIKPGVPVKTGYTGSGHVKLFQHAYAPASAKKPKKKAILIGSLVGGLLGGLFLMFFLEHIDPTFRNAQELRRSLSVPLLGAVPRRALRPRSALALGYDAPEPNLEAFMPLATQIQSLCANLGVKTLYYAPAEPTRSNIYLGQALAWCLSRLGQGEDEANNGSRGVLLVEPGRDAGFFLGKRFDIPEDKKTLGDFLTGDAALYQSIVPVNDKLSVATMGFQNGRRKPSEFKMSRYKDFLESASGSFDMVMVRGAYPMGHALYLNSLCDSTVVVVNEQRTRRKALKSMLESLSLNGRSVLGVIVNDQKRPLPGFLYNAV